MLTTSSGYTVGGMLYYKLDLEQARHVRERARHKTECPH